MRIIRILIEPQPPRVLVDLAQLAGNLLVEVERVLRELLFLLQNLLELLLTRLAGEVLPWQLPQVQVQQHVANRLQVVPATLFRAIVRVDARVPRCAHHAFVFRLRDMLS